MPAPKFSDDQAYEIVKEFIDDDTGTITSYALRYKVDRETMHKLLHAKSYPRVHHRISDVDANRLCEQLQERQRGKIDKATAERIWRLYVDNPKLGKDRIAVEVGVSPGTVHAIVAGRHHSEVRQSASDSEQRRVRRKRTNQTSGSKLTDDEAAELLVRLGRGEFKTLDDFCEAASVSAELFKLVVTGRYGKGSVTRGWEMLGPSERHQVVSFVDSQSVR